jgi:hypothetical protein
MIPSIHINKALNINYQDEPDFNKPLLYTPSDIEIHTIFNRAFEYFIDANSGFFPSNLNRKSNLTLIGDLAHERIIGMDGHDILKGSFGHDYLNGNSGNDQLYGGRGDDSLEGRSGSDSYFIENIARHISNEEQDFIYEKSSDKQGDSIVIIDFPINTMKYKFNYTNKHPSALIIILVDVRNNLVQKNLIHIKVDEKGIFAVEEIYLKTNGKMNGMIKLSDSKLKSLASKSPSGPITNLK